MLRSHDVAYDYDEEVGIKNGMLSRQDSSMRHGKVILFLTIFEVRPTNFSPLLMYVRGLTFLYCL